MSNIRLCKIIIGARCSRVETSSASVLSLLYQALRVRVHNYQFMPRYQNKSWDGYAYYFHDRTGVFKTGLLLKVLKCLTAADIKPEIVDERDFGAVSDKLDLRLHGVSLTDAMYSYQADAVAIGLAAKHGVFEMAVNSGKTEVMAALVKNIAQKALICVHVRELLYQTRSRLQQRLKRDIGIIGAGEWAPADITVGMVQTLYKTHNQKAISYLQTIRVLMLDETHHQVAKSWIKLSSMIPAPWRFGFSGTAFDADKESSFRLMAETGPLICHVSSADLIARGVSAKPKVYMIEFEHHGSEDTWQHTMRVSVVQNQNRNMMIAKIIKTLCSDSTLVICLQLEILRNVKTELTRCGIHAVTSFGPLAKNKRAEAFDDIAAGRAKVLLTTTLYDEGVDLPAIKNLVLVYGGTDHRKLVQRIGRVLRKKKTGDNTAVVIDIADAGDVWLARQTLNRYRHYMKEGFDVELLSFANFVKRHNVQT